jgi:purine-binding chemotaxis protein CheW
MSSESLVVFSIGDRRCALPSGDVVKLLPLPRLACPPGLARFMAGFLDLGGRMVPVVALGELFGMGRPAADDVYAHVVLVRNLLPGGPVGLLVDRVLGVPTVGAGAVKPVAEGETLNGCVTGEVDVDGVRVCVLATGRILIEQERQRLAEFREAAEQRLDAWQTPS